MYEYKTLALRPHKDRLKGSQDSPFQPNEIAETLNIQAKDGWRVVGVVGDSFMETEACCAFKEDHPAKQILVFLEREARS